MNEEHIIKQHGRDYVLFAGLVAEAHEKFLGFSLTAELDATSTEDKPRVKAHFEGDYIAEDGSVHTITTTGIGTAGRATDRRGPAQDAPVEMAETRAKARALRVAVNIGETAFEEIPLEASPEASPDVEAEYRRASRNIKEAHRAHPPEKRSSRDSEAKVTPEVLRQLRFLADTFSEARGEDEEEHWRSFTDNLGYDPADMSEGEAYMWMVRYQKGLKKLESTAREAPAK